MILVTGADGFIGVRVCSVLRGRGHHVRGAIRRSAPPETGCETVVVGDISCAVDWSAALLNVDTIVHLAARAHVLNETAVDPLDEYRRTNSVATVELARQAVRAGVKRFVFMSSVGVNGASTNGMPFVESSRPAPHNDYALTKYEAENGLQAVSRETGLDVVIVRAPLVYGPGVKANFLRLLRVVRQRIPLPFGSLDNSRSLIGLGNLADAVVTCSVEPKAAGNTYMVSDGDDVSTPELVRRIAAALGCVARLFPVHVQLIRLAGMMTGRLAVVDRVIGSLTVDSSRIRRELGWKPPFIMEQELAKTAEWYLK